jgi:hypothetical protein
MAIPAPSPPSPPVVIGEGADLRRPSLVPTASCLKMRPVFAQLVPRRRSVRVLLTGIRLASGRASVLSAPCGYSASRTFAAVRAWGPTGGRCGSRQLSRSLEDGRRSLCSVATHDRSRARLYAVSERGRGSNSHPIWFGPSTPRRAECSWPAPPRGPTGSRRRGTLAESSGLLLLRRVFGAMHPKAYVAGAGVLTSRV